MADLSHLRLIQFRAAYNLPVHSAVENGIFAKHGLEVEAAYTPGSDFLIAALQEGKFEIGHLAADDVVAAVEVKKECDLFLFMGLHSGLLSLWSLRNIAAFKVLEGKPSASIPNIRVLSSCWKSFSAPKVFRLGTIA